MNKATLRLFNCIQVNEKSPATKPLPEAVLRKTLAEGYIIDATIDVDEALLEEINQVVGLSGEKANAAFHKSWAVIADSSQKRLWMQAVLHYMTVYGFQGLGVYSEEAVYFPGEKLELPDRLPDIPVRIIKAMTAAEILGEILKLADGIALSEDSLNDILTIIRTNKYDPNSFVEKIKNRELKTLLFDHYGIAPTEPEMFLRYIVRKLTGESLLIKNSYLFNKIKKARGTKLDAFIENAPKDLHTIFFRYKPLFLAMKAISKNKTFFNRLRKKAENDRAKFREPYYLKVTASIKEGRFSAEALEKSLLKATIYQKARLLYALKFRSIQTDSIVYRIRNGRGWATEFYPFNSGIQKKMNNIAMGVVSLSIVKELSARLKGKTIVIPSHVSYSLPSSEKQFIGNVPAGTCISTPGKMIFGIHWCNKDTELGWGSVDLDLAVLSKSGKIGWDNNYRSRDLEVLFSGDVVDAPAPLGASELFYVKRGRPDEPRLVTLNHYNFSRGDKTPVRVMVGVGGDDFELERNHMLDPNKLLASELITIDKKQNVVGVVFGNENETVFYFSHFSTGSLRSSREDKNSKIVRKYLLAGLLSRISLEDLLSMAGANIVTEKPDEGSFIDLSLESLTKSTIIDLVGGQSD